MAYSLRQAYDYWQDQPGSCGKLQSPLSDLLEQTRALFQPGGRTAMSLATTDRSTTVREHVRGIGLFQSATQLRCRSRAIQDRIRQV